MLLRSLAPERGADDGVFSICKLRVQNREIKAADVAGIVTELTEAARAEADSADAALASAVSEVDAEIATLKKQLTDTDREMRAVANELQSREGAEKGQNVIEKYLAWATIGMVGVCSPQRPYPRRGCRTHRSWSPTPRTRWEYVSFGRCGSRDPGTAQSWGTAPTRAHLRAGTASA